VSQPGELTPAQDAGLASISLASWAVEGATPWAADSHVGLRGLTEWADGSAGEIYDVWLRYGPLERPGS
jgi:hypothetical protein